MDKVNFNIDEGYVKFNCEWNNIPLKITVPEQLKIWRDKMHQLKLIGHYSKINVGYGNISIKTDSGFLISGTQTGSVFPIKDTDFTLVTDYDITKNKVVCNGPIKASSESMTHAAIYEANSSIKAIIHIHNLNLWNKLMYKLPTTKNTVAYGTPEMANEIFRLFKESQTNEERIIVMAGHEEGIISFGKNLDEAGNTILKYID